MHGGPDRPARAASQINLCLVTVVHALLAAYINAKPRDEAFDVKIDVMAHVAMVLLWVGFNLFAIAWALKVYWGTPNTGGAVAANEDELEDERFGGEDAAHEDEDEDAIKPDSPDHGPRRNAGRSESTYSLGGML